MPFIFKNHKLLIILLNFTILSGCQLKDANNNHGILFLENRSNKLVLNNSNINDTIRIIGKPHYRSQDNKNTWFYVERTLSKGDFHKLGRNVLKKNNILILHFNKYGILEKKEFLDKYDKKKVKFSKNTTENDLSKTSFVESFLSSLREKMYGRK